MPRHKKPPTPEQRLASLGERVRKARSSRGWSMAQLAREASVPTSRIHDIEHGTHMPTIPSLDRVAEALDLPISFFLS